MESNHRFLFVRQVSSPLDHRTWHVKLRELESNQRPPGSEPGVTTSSNCPALSTFRIMTIETQSCGGRNRTCVLTVNSRPPVPTRAPPQHQKINTARSRLDHRNTVGPEGFEPSSNGLKVRHVAIHTTAPKLKQVGEGFTNLQRHV